jgi:hypothetical protein
MHKNATKCNETLSKWCKNKHGASKIMDTLEAYQLPPPNGDPSFELKPLPNHFKYAYLDEKNICPVIISANLFAG